MTRFLAALVLILAILAAPGAPARAATVDINLIGPQTSGGSVGLQGAMLQTFLPTISGFLTQLDLQIFGLSRSGPSGPPVGNSAVQVSIVSTTGGLPDVSYDTATSTFSMAALGAVVHGALDVGHSQWDVVGGAFTSFDFSAQSLFLSAGTLYGIVLQQLDTSHGSIYWAGDSMLDGNNQVVGIYADGQAGAINFASSAPAVSMTDRADNTFATWMAPATVPLPAAAWLLLGALASLGAVRCRAA